jgi:hypothetical protein
MLQVDKKSDQRLRHMVRRVVVAIGALTIAGVATSSSPLVVLMSGGVCIFILVLLWRPNDAPILLVPTLFQFVAVALKPITTAFTNSSLQDLADFNSNLEPAALFGLAGVAVLALGLRMGVRNAPAARRDSSIGGWSFKRVLSVALVTIVFGHVLDLVAERSGGARQILLGLSGVKWAGLFILAYCIFDRRRGLRWLVAVVTIEIILGMSGFFAEFRLTLFVLLGAAIAAHRTLGGRGIVVLTAGVVLTVFLAVFWSSVKESYRYFLNQGTGEQVVLQSFDDRLAYLANQATEFNEQRFADGFQRLLGRLSYIDFLAATMERVPQVLPHEGGALLGMAILHVLTPRILFPNKLDPPSDTRVTAHYTGLEAAVWANESTSISIGYLGELYIDFGVMGALFAVFLIGLAYGRCYRMIRDHAHMPTFVNYGLCMMVALTFTTFETALIKLIGSLVMVLVAALVLQRVVWPVLFRSGYAGTFSAHRFGRGT